MTPPPSLRCHSSTDHRDEGYFTRPAWLLPVWGKRLGTDNPRYHIYSGWARWCWQLRSAQRDDGCFGWAEKWAAAHQRATGATSESTGYVWEGGWGAHLLHAPVWSCFGTADAVLPHVSYWIQHYVMYVIHCIGQKSVQTAADSLVEELWSQVEALKKGFTGRKKTIPEFQHLLQ